MRRGVERSVLVTALTTTLTLLVLSGCASLGPVGERLEQVGGQLSESLSKLELPSVLRGGNGSTSDSAAPSTPRRAAARAPARSADAYVASEFEKTEVPHTLMSKPVADGRLTSRFGYRRNPTGFLRMPKRHKGIDYAAPGGTPVFAAGAGTVDKLYKSRSYGNYVSIAHDNGFRTAYAHLAAFAEGLSVGDHVTRGQQIGAVGSTGRSTSDHLHFELVHKGRHVDPLLGK